MKIYKRVLSLVITLALIIGMIPMSAITADALDWGMFDGGTIDAGETATITCYSGGVVVTNLIFESRGTTVGKLTRYDDDGVLVYEEDILGGVYHGWTYCSGTYIIEVYYGAIDIQWNGANGGVPTISFEQNNLKMDYFIKPNMSTMYLAPGETQELFIQDVYPGYEAELRDECFESNNSSIASVTEDGVITANREGETQVKILYTFTSAAGKSIQLTEPCDVIVVDDAVNKETGLRFYYSDEEIEPGETVQIGADYSFGDFTGMYYPGTVEWQLSNENVLKVIQTVDNITMIRVEALAIGECELSLVLDGEVKCTETISVTLTDDTLIKEYKDYLMNCAVMTTLSDARDTCWDVIGRYSSGSRTRIAFMTCLKDDLGLSVITKEALAALNITSSTHQDTVDEAVDLLMAEICSSEEAWFSDGLSTFKKRYKNYGAFTKTTAFTESSFEYSLAQFTSFSEKQIKDVSGVAKGFISDSISMAELVSAAVMTVQYERDVVVSLMNTVAAAPGGTSSDLYKGLERLLWEMDNLDVYVAHRYLNNKMVGSLQSLIEDGLFYSDDNFKMFDSTVWKVATGIGKLIALAYENEGGVFADDYMKACVTSGFASTLYHALMNSDSASELEYSFKFYVPAVKVALDSAIGLCDDAIVNCSDLKGIAEGYLLQIDQTCTYEKLLDQCRMAVKGASDFKSNVYIEDGEIVVDAYWELPETNALMLTDMEDGDFYTTGYTSDQLIIVPSHINGEKVTGIAANGFKFITNRYGIVLPDSVVKIGDYAFSDCPQVTFVVLGDNLKELGAYAFNNNYALQVVNLPSSLEVIKEGAFNNCYKISSIITNAAQIDSKAFSNCTSLTSVTIKNKDAVIATDAFDNCNSELTIYGYKNTDAEKIANEKGYNFVELSETVSRIEIVSAATKTEYEVGEDVDTDGMTLKVTYMDGSTETLEDGWVAYGDTSKPGSATIKVYYEDKVTTYDVTILEPEAYSVKICDTSLTLLYGSDKQLFANILPNASKNVKIVWTTSNPNVATVDVNGYVEAIGTGSATISATIMDSDISANCEITVVDTKEIDPAVSTQDYITFTARENGYYVFYSVGSGRNITGSILDINGNTLYSNSGTDFRVEGQLHKDKTYTFKTSTNSKNNVFKIVINKSVDAETLSIKDSKSVDVSEISGYPNDTQKLYYGFTPVNYITEECTWESSNTSVAKVDEYGKVTMVAPGTATITLKSEKGLTDTCDVVVNKFIDAPTINVNEIKSVVISEETERVYYSFTPEEDAWFVLRSLNGETPYCYLLDSDGMSLASSMYVGEGNNFRLEYKLTAGETYVYMCDFYYSTTVGTYDIKLEKMIPAEAVSIVEGDSLTKYIKETVNLSVEFAPKHCIKENITWTSNDESVATVDSQGKVTMVSPGEAKITATSENGLIDECAITVLDYPTISVGEQKTVEINDDFKNRYFYFTPEKDGTYVFYSISNSDTYGYLLNSSGSTLKTDDQSGEGSNFRIEYALTGGETYVLRCKYYYSSTNGFFDVCVYELVDAEYVQITDGDSFTGYVETQHALSAELLPMISRDQSMTWTSTDDTIVSVDQDGLINLLKPGSATITVTTESGLSDSIVVTVKDFSAINVGSKNTVEITEKDPSISFKFTPTESGWYSFYSNSDSDTYCRLFNSSGDELTNDDNSGVENNFRIDYQLEAGETYIFRCSYASSGVFGTYDVELEKSETDLTNTLILDKEYHIYSEGTSTSKIIVDKSGFYKITVVQRDKTNYPDIYDNIDVEVTPECYHSGYSKGYSQNGYYVYEDTDVYYFEADNEYSINVKTNGVLPANLIISKVPEPTSVSLSATTLSFTEGDYGQTLYVTLSPEYTFGHYTWESSDESVATVDEHGFVKPVGEGEATITLSVNGTSLTANCTVSVEGVEKTEIEIEEDYTDLPVGVYFVQPSVSGYYSIIFNDCYMDLNDNRYNSIGWINPSYNMACKYLEAGQTYIFEVTSIYNSGAYGSIQPCDAPTGISLDKEIKLTPNSLKTIYVTTQNEGSYFDHASATFTLADPDIAEITTTYSRGNITQWNQFYESYFTIEGLKIGQTMLTITTKDGGVYTFPVVIEDYPSIYDGSRFELSLAADENAIYSFVPEESASFTLEASGSQGCSIYVRDENNNYLTGVGENYWGEGHYVSVAYEFEEGKTYYVEIEGDYLYDGDFVFQLNKTVDASELVISETDLSGYVGESYTLSYELFPKHSFDEVISWESSDESVATVDENGVVVFVSEGTTTITATSENGLVATCVVEVKNIPSITCDEDKILNTNSDSGTGLFSFVPEVDGMYVFYSYDNDFDTYGYILDENMNTLDSDDDNGEGNNFKVVYSLVAGTQYYLKAKPLSSGSIGEYRVKVVKLVPATSVNIIPDGDINIFEGYEYRFDAELDPENSIDEALTWTSSNTSVATIDNDGNITALTAGTSTITVTTENGLTDSITVTVHAPEEIELNETKDTTITSEIDRNVFSFTPSEDGQYIIKISGDYYTQTSVQDTEMNWINSNSGYYYSFKVSLSADENYRIATVLWDEAESGEYSITIEKLVPATSLEITQEGTDGGYVGDYGYLYTNFGPENAIVEEITWVSSNPEVAVIESMYDSSNIRVNFVSAGTTTITATSANGLTDSIVITVTERPSLTSIEIGNGDSLTGYVGIAKYLWVNFYPDGAAHEQLTWSSDNEAVATVNEEGKVELLTTGTVNITVVSESGFSDTCTITVGEVSTLTIGQPVNLTIVDNEEQYVKFVPTESGLFRIYVSDFSNSNRARITLCDSSMNWLVSEYDEEFIDYEFVAGQTYYIETNYCSWYGSGNGTYNLNAIKPVPATSISFDIGSEYNGYVGTSRYVNVIYAPDHAITESITWSSTDSSIVSVNRYGEITLNAVGTATITATSENGLVYSCVITVEDFETIEVGQEKNVVLDGEEAYYHFTPNEDGYYSFYSYDNDHDTYGYILNSDMEIITSDDDGGDGNNFKVKYQLEAGVTYVLKARFFNTENSGSFKVCVEQTKYVTALEIVSLPEKTEYVEGFVNAGNINYYGLKLKVTWSDGSTTNWKYDYDWSVDGEYIYRDASNIEETGVVELTCGEASVSLTLTIIENPVEHIEIVSGTEISYVENYNGYVDENGDGEFFYYHTNYPYDAVIRIVYKDGTSKTAKVGESVNDYSISWEHNQHEEPWVVGTNNKSLVTYLGHTVVLPITVKENTVTGIEVVSGKVTCIENAYGYEMDNGYYYYYDMPSDVTLKISYADGSSKVVGINEVVDGYRFNWDTDQHETPWVLGDNNYLTVSYLGSETQLPVSIITSPVERIVINSAPTREYVYGDTTYGYLYSDGEYEFYPTDLSGLSFTVYYVDGTNKTFTAEDINEFGDINGYGYELYYDEYNAQIGDFPVQFMYMGKTANYTVVLKEPTVSSIAITKQPNRVEYNNLYAPDFIGMEITITYTDETTKVVTLTEDNLVYEYNPGWGELSYVVDVDGYNLTIEPYYGENMYYVASYLGAQCDIDDIIFADSKEIDSIELDNVSSNGDGMTVEVTYTDESTETLTLELVEFFDYENSSGSGYGMTANGLLYYYIETYTDDTGKPEKYRVYIFNEEITVEADAVVIGDVNGDGALDNLDRLTITRYLANWDGYTEANINMAVADVNQDGSVDNLDRLILTRHLANWEGYETLLVS